MKKMKIEKIYERKDARVLYEALEAGGEMPWHKHANTRDVFYGLKGEVVVMKKNPDEEETVGPGELCIVEAGRVHRSINKSGERAEWILIQGVGDVEFEEIK